MVLAATSTISRCWVHHGTAGLICKGPHASQFRHLPRSCGVDRATPIPAILSRYMHASKTDGRASRDILIYERNSAANFKPRFAISCSYLCCAYSTWYWAEFIPAANNSGIPGLYVNPAFGVAGFGLSLTLAGVANMYAWLMVSKIVYRKNSAKPIRVYRHSLPFMRPSSECTEYALGETKLDDSSDDVKSLVDVLGKAETTSITASHLPLRIVDSRRPLAIHLTSMDDIKDNAAFLDVLIAGTTPVLAEGKPKRRRTARKKSR